MRVESLGFRVQGFGFRVSVLSLASPLLLLYALGVRVEG